MTPWLASFSFSAPPFRRRAREDDSIKAVVLRIDSGGGSALASDLISREVRRATKQENIDVEEGARKTNNDAYVSLD